MTAFAAKYQAFLRVIYLFHCSTKETVSFLFQKGEKEPHLSSTEEERTRREIGNRLSSQNKYLCKGRDPSSFISLTLKPLQAWRFTLCAVSHFSV